MNQFLSINILYQHNTNLMPDVMHLIEKMQCRTEISHLLRLGDHTNLTIFISGTWDSIAKLETNLAPIGKKKGITMQVVRSQPTDNELALLPYSVEIITPLSTSGILAELGAFFAHQGVSIEEITVETYPSRCNILLSYVLMHVYIPADLELSELREQFIILCDDLNIDAALEPERN